MEVYVYKQACPPEAPRTNAMFRSKAIAGKYSFSLVITILVSTAVLSQGLGSYNAATPGSSGHARVFFQSAPAQINITLSVPSQETVQVGSVLTFTVNATDPYNPTRTVYLSASGLPLGAAFPPSSGNPIYATFSWGPTSTQGPGNYTITFQASYTQTSPLVTKIVLIQVVKAQKHLPPTLSVPGPQTISPGTLLSFAIVAEDPNLPPSPVNVTAAGLPHGSSFDPSTGIFSWKPTGDQAPGVYVLIFTASDVNGMVTSKVTITVLGSSGLVPLPLSPVDYLAYAPWVFLPALIVSLLYILQLKRRGRNDQDRFIRRPLGPGVNPGERQAPPFSAQPSQRRLEKD